MKNKILVLLLVFSLPTCSLNLMAKERRGVELVIQKLDGKELNGELIAVGQDSLILLSPEGVERSIDIGDIAVIKIVKKSKTLERTGLPILILGGTGALGGYLIGGKSEGSWFSIPRGQTALVGAAFGTFMALIAIAFASEEEPDELFQIKGMSDLEINRVLYNLRSKARVKDYL